MTRDRTGDEIEPDTLAAAGEHLCRRGWLSSPGADSPIPCLRCRPWLAWRRPPTKRELAAFAQRHPTPARRTP